MTASSLIQFDATRHGQVPSIEPVRDGIWALGSHMPGHPAYSLAYVICDADDGIHLIDPGWDSERNWTRLLKVLGEIGSHPSAVRSVTSTHLHPDHIGMAQRLREHTGAQLQVHRLERDDVESAGYGRRESVALETRIQSWKVPSEPQRELSRLLKDVPPQPRTVVDRTLEDGERLDVSGRDLIVMLTPGHTRGSICIRDDANQVLFSGDTILPAVHPALGLGLKDRVDHNPLTAYLSSLERLSAYPEYEVLPGHGFRFEGLVDRSRQHAGRHLSRAREVEQSLLRRPSDSVWELASRVTWSAGWANLSGVFLYSALAQTALYKDFLESGGASTAEEKADER
ncbi:MBL fold metallo-hydrolase [uncultured Microbacterium sp.]|uniref:MBL fold metallo-hydrolase n=1 Tax=uncultured Microbacterium sp. TaxID=191216 RepID=UPI0035CC4CE1